MKRNALWVLMLLASCSACGWGQAVPAKAPSACMAMKKGVAFAGPVLCVSPDGAAGYSTVQEAVQHLPAEGGLVLLGPGTYRERVWVQGSHVALAGTTRDASKTRIVFDLSAGTLRDAHSPIPGMATVTVSGDDFRAENLTFENDFNRTHEQVSQGSQAQALNLGGDRNLLRNVRIEANQDTLYVGAKGCGQSSGPVCTPTRSYFADCYVAGNVDFIYGDGIAVFDRCEVHNTPHAAGGYITAQGKHYPEELSFFEFLHCKLTVGEGVGPVFLGRPWRPYASVLFAYTEMGAHIAPAGWREWHPGETHYLDTVNYAELGSTGPGGARTGRDPHGRQMADDEASSFRPSAVFEVKGLPAWDPERVKSLLR